MLETDTDDRFPAQPGASTPDPVVSECHRESGDADDDALVALLHEHEVRLRGLLRRLCRGDVVEADELWQRAASRAWHYRASLRAGDAAGGWLRQTVWRVFLDERRRRGRAPLLDRDLEDGDGATTEQATAGGREAFAVLEAREQLDRLLGLLRADERDVLLRMHRHGQPVVEIAAALGMNQNTVKSHARRGRERMLAALREEER